LATLVLLLTFPAFAAPPRTKTRLALKVVSVHNGDIFTGLNDANEQVNMRLDAVDAPELTALTRDANARPWDPTVRLELAATCDALGKKELAAMWRHSAAACGAGR
jgi:endonuclease YncB( thermonuclease family)